MKRILLICLTLSFHAMTLTVLVQMPDKQTLHNRLIQAGFQHFTKNSTLVDELCNKQLDILCICLIVDGALYDYMEYLQKTKSTIKAYTINAGMQLNKSLLLTVLLQDSPDGLNKLRRQGLYNPPSIK